MTPLTPARTCYYAGRDLPRMVRGRHVETCGRDGECRGCQPCTAAHCRVCGIEHSDGTCPDCLDETRDTLRQIVQLCGDLPAEAVVRGVDSEAAMLWGPATDWERWGHVQASIAVGRLPADWCEVADSETHPLYVLGSWDAMVRDVLDHDEPEERVTIGEAARYLDMQLTYLAGFDDLPFEDMARDLRRCLSHLEAVLHDGEQRDTGAPCLDCRVPLVREWGERAADDGWRCPRCRRFSTDAQYRFAVMHLHRDSAEWLTDKEMQLRTGVPCGTIRRWALEGLVEKRMDSGRRVYRVAHVEAEARRLGRLA